MRRNLLFASLLSMLTLFSCSEAGLGSLDQDGKEVSFSGYIQKGPFTTGTSVDVKELDSSLNSTGKIFSTQITNDFGNFEISCNSDHPYAEFVAHGYYFDEVEGEISEGELKLRAISTMDKSTNINILTTLQADRMRSLIKSGKEYDEALVQSKKEVLQVFHINEEEVANFNNMDITKQGASNSILLAISSILQYDRGVGEMSELISKLSLDIADNGTIDNSSLTDKITESSKEVNCAEVIRNLEERYKELNKEVSIDNFYDFIDSDGDGILNGGAPYLFIDQSYYSFDFEASEQAIYFNSNYTPKVEIISDEEFITVKSISATKVTLEFAENAGERTRTAELQFISADGEVIESVDIEQLSSYSELAFYFGFGSSATRATIPGSDIEVKRVTIIAFDNNEKLIFNNDDRAPILDGNEYKVYHKLAKNYYENCTVYTIINGLDDYSAISKISDAEELKTEISTTDMVLSAKNEGASFSSGRPSDDEYEEILMCPSINVKLKITGVAQLEIGYRIKDIAMADREVSSIKILGQICNNSYIFKDSTEGLETSQSKSINLDNLTTSEWGGSITTYVGGGTQLSGLEVTLKSGKKCTLELNDDVILSAGNMYAVEISISAEDLTTGNTTVSDPNSFGDTDIPLTK